LQKLPSGCILSIRRSVSPWFPTAFVTRIGCSVSQGFPSGCLGLISWVPLSHPQASPVNSLHFHMSDSAVFCNKGSPYKFRLFFTFGGLPHFPPLNQCFTAAVITRVFQCPQKGYFLGLGTKGPQLCYSTKHISSFSNFSRPIGRAIELCFPGVFRNTRDPKA